MSKHAGGKHSVKHSVPSDDGDPEFSRLAKSPQHSDSRQPAQQFDHTHQLDHTGHPEFAQQAKQGTRSQEYRQHAERREHTEQSAHLEHRDGSERPGHSGHPSYLDHLEHADQAPQRRSISERLASLDQSTGTQVAGLDASPLTMTTTALRLSDTSVFGITSTGQVSTEQAPSPVAQNLHLGSQGQPLDRETADQHHLLIVGEDVSSDELEALAISIWDDAGWINPGVLSLGAGGTLLGWWHIDDQVRHAIHTPADLTVAWVLDCPKIRGQAPDESLKARDRWAHAFPDGMPAGVELKTLLALERMARRLAGAIRVSDSGDVITPDADSAVDLRIYSPRWVGPEDLAQALRVEFPDVLDSRDVQPARMPKMSAAQLRNVAALAGDLPPIPEPIQQVMRADRSRQQPQIVDGYALMAHVGNRSTMMVEVHGVPRPPRVLRWESWPSGVVVEYALRWLPQGSVEGARSGLTRTERLERLRSAAGIERAAGIVVQVAGGMVVDEDGFLVGVDQV